MERWVKTQAIDEFLCQWYSPAECIEIHTSGSTGTPKHIRLLKADMTASASATNRYFGINSTSRLWLPLSATYIAGKMMAVRAIVSKATLIAENPTNQILQNWDGRDIDLLAIVPSQTQALLSHTYRQNVKHVIIGGAPLTPQQEDTVIRAGIKAWATYGMTETCSHVALRPLGIDTYTALPGFNFSTDPRSCLVIHSRTMSFGSLVTNDVVELQTPTQFKWLGRADNVINSGGIKIHPEQIEAIISRHFTDRPFFVSSQASERWGQEAVMIVESQDYAMAAESLAIARRSHPQLLFPSKIVAVEKIPLTPTGKIKRHP